MSSENHNGIEGPPPGTNGAGGPGDIPEDEKEYTVDTAKGAPQLRDEAHQ